jgi:hypothetical protein
MKMPKRQKRVKLSKAQILENDTNKWLAKKAAAIDMLCKAMDRLKSLDRSHRRLQKAALHPVQKKIADKLNAATALEDRMKPLKEFVQRGQKAQAAVDEITGEDRAKRMEAMGFRKTRKKSADKAQTAITG